MAAKISNQKLMDEFDKRIESIRRSYNDEQMLSLLKSLESLDHSAPPLVQEETPPPPAPSRDAYFYLYLQRHEKLSRLNVTNLSKAPVFELVCDFGRSHHRNCLSPVVCFNVESEFFMVGDHFIRPEQRPKFCQPFFDFFTAKPPSFLPCPPTISRAPTAPKVDPLVIPLHGKFYVLALHLYMDQPCFEVFNNGDWNTLPRPPYFPRTERDDGGQNLMDIRLSFHAHYAWDHKIVVCLEGGSYCFDTQEGAWTDMQHIYTGGEKPPILQCVAKYDEFLIAKPIFSEELLVYDLGADGFPHLHQNLDGLEEMFADSSIKGSDNAFIIPFDDDADKFCFICSGITPSYMDISLQFLFRVGVFRMTISNLDGKKKVTAVLEAHQIYPFYKVAGSSFFPNICSAFLKRDDLNLDNLKADQSLGRACLN